MVILSTHICFWTKGSTQSLMLYINTCEPVFVGNLQQGTVCGWPYEDCMYGNGKMHMEVMHILPMNLFMQESDNLAPDVVRWVSSWHLAKWSLSVVFKAAQPAFKISLFAFRQKVKPSAFNLLFHSRRPQMWKTPQSEEVGFSTFYSLIQIWAKRPCQCLRTWINWEVKTNLKLQQMIE